MNRLHPLLSSFLLTLTALAAGGAAESVRADLQVELHRHPMVTSRSIQLSDIATITGVDRQQVLTAGALDLEQIADGETTVALSRSYIAFRMAIAGISRRSVRMEGPETVVVTLQELPPLNDQDVETAAMKTMQQVLGLSADDLRVRLANPFIEHLPKGIREHRGLRVEVAPPVRITLGIMPLSVRLWEGGNLVESRNTQFEVLRRHRVAVTRVSLERDSTISASDVQFENRFLATTADEPEEKDILGHRVRNNLRPGQLVSLRDIAQPVALERAVVVKRRDKVQVTALSGSLRIRLRQAEAMDDGRVGDFILLKNLESKRIITGRVVSAGEVEIRLR
ncbi:MAG: flagellar basal body P-ring formation chaperone FlgA [Fuerstiella sp.]